MLRQTIAGVGMAVGILASTSIARAEVVIETVTVGNPGNTGELSGAGAGGYGPDRICGAVNYVYRIGKFEITAGQYAAFLNAVAKTDPYGLYNASMNSNSYGCQITQNGLDGNFTYDFSGGTVEAPGSTAADWENRPVNFVSWGDAARFCNWLHNGQPNGTLTGNPAQDAGLTEDGSYYLNGATSDAALLAVVREPDATWVIPSEDEWYKAAYHKNDGVTGNYWDYPTGSNTAPTSEAPPGTDMTNGSANYYGSNYAIGAPYYRTEVGAYDIKPSDSPYATFDQGGNVREWNEAVIASCRGLRGGSSYDGHADLHAAIRLYSYYPTYENNYIGFRVATFADCNRNHIPDECDLDCDATIGTTGGSCSAVYPGCGQSTDENGNGVLDDCTPDIPTVSEWGVVAMTLLVLTAGTVVLTRRRTVTAR